MKSSLTLLLSLLVAGGTLAQERSRLLLTRIDGDRARCLPVTLGKDGPRLGTELEAGMLVVQDPDDKASRKVWIAAYDGGSRLISAEGKPGAYQVVARDLAGKELGRVAVGETQPAALHLAGELAVLGQGNRVATLDFAKSTLKIAHTRADMEHKAYDLFVQHGDWLVAIDDVVMPIWADTFRVKGGRLTHEKGWELPGLVNGQYRWAALHMVGPRQGTLFVHGFFESMYRGAGQCLAALPIVKGNLEVDPSKSLQNTHSLSVLEEYRPHEGELRLTAGEEITVWWGLAVLARPQASPQILAAAQGRGLLVIPTPFKRSTKAKALDLGDDCYEVKVFDGRVWVIVVGEERSTLLELDPTSFEVRSRTKLPAKFYGIY